MQGIAGAILYKLHVSKDTVWSYALAVLISGELF